jgi:hypothetical protein
MSAITGGELARATGRLARAKARRAQARALGLDEKLAKGRALVRPCAAATVTVPNTWAAAEFGRRLDASIRIGGFIRPSDRLDLTALWHVLSENIDYCDHGGHYHVKRDPQRALRPIIGDADRRGYTFPLRSRQSRTAHAAPPHSPLSSALTESIHQQWAEVVPRDVGDEVDGAG